MFTTQHYSEIARAIRNAQVSMDNDGGEVILNANALLDSLCALFQRDNERFNAQKFREACVSK